MATIALVHGAWHGGWCWELIVPPLERGGHRVVCPDLPCDDPDAGFDDYADVVAAALEGETAPVVVGHSLAGMTIPLVAARRPVARLVFLCAALPPGWSPAGGPERFQASFLDGSERDEAGRVHWPPEAAVGSMYARVEPSLARRAAARLRPQAWGLVDRPYPLAQPPPVPCASIVATEDESFHAAWSRWAAREILGVEPVELPGGHFPMLERPLELAEVLCRALEDPQ